MEKIMENSLIIERKNLSSTIFYLLLFVFYLQASVDCWVWEDSFLGRDNFHTKIEKEWPATKSRSLSLYIQPHKITTILQPSHYCKSAKPYLNIIVVSKDDNFESRHEIRFSKGIRRRVDSKKITINFLIGLSKNSSVNEKIQEESQDYGDIIQESFHTSFYNATIEIGMAFKWIIKNCNNTQYFGIFRDDSHIDSVNLIETISRIQKNKNKSLLIGHLKSNEYASRDPYSDWYMPSYEFEDEYYPQYLETKNGYIMSFDVVKKIYNVAMSQPFVHFDDVFFTGICAEKAGVKRVDIKN
ncbi:beta-1,3-galactosyltransferase 5-like [Aphidius gifuensis]|nr:beta-1,3-galactosyltransferase 5-like [Aphidius gifuensis]